MDRALALDLLKEALGEHKSLPGPEELQRILERAEIDLMLWGPRVDDALIEVAWYLHGIASAPRALQLYTIDRQRRAFQVSAHIFDLALRARRWERDDVLRMVFASQVGYIQSEVNPNAIAVYRRVPVRLDLSFRATLTTIALEAGSLVLASERQRGAGLLQRLRDEVMSFEKDLGLQDILRTVFGASAGVVLGAHRILEYLTNGTESSLEAARANLTAAVVSPEASADIDARWVAAQLLALLGGLADTSVWRVFPPSTPPEVRRAFALGDPPVLSLWPPQVRALRPAKGLSLLTSDVRRALVSFPTSGGKTLLAQLMVVAHLADSHTDVCYVAPTNSLCREVRESLRRRLRFLERDVESDVSLLQERETISLPPPNVEVMTPERLAFLLRSSPVGSLQRFGLFVIDEAHLIGDRERGWTLEGALAFLQSATAKSHHRIVLLSSAVGNRIHFAKWLDAEGEGIIAHDDWRGPRRLTCVYTTEPDWSAEKLETAKAPRALTRWRTPLHGVLRIQTVPQRPPTKIAIGDVGTLIQSVDKAGRKRKDRDRSSRNYEMLIPLVRQLGRHGPLLLICATKPSARRHAEALANELPRAPESVQQIADLAALRLGELHPVAQTLRHGVATHYATLPEDLLTAMEGAIRSGDLTYVVATTTLTEGVNLPVHSVVVAETGAYGVDGFDEYISGPRLINALGRAGRATKECEGWVVLYHQAPYTAAAFNTLLVSSDDVVIRSEIATPQALDALITFEQRIAAGEDAVFEGVGGIVDRFIAFVWFVADGLAAVNHDKADEEFLRGVQATLAWQQLEDSDRQRWVRAAQAAYRGYVATDVARRRRWSAAGTSIASARKLEALSVQLAQASVGRTDIARPRVALELLSNLGVLSAILDLPEAPVGRLIWSAQTGARRRVLELDLLGLLIDWLAGTDIAILAGRYLAGVANEQYRFEQLSTFLTSVVSSYLSWILGIVIEWANQDLAAVSFEQVRLPVELPPFLRLGVESTPALTLMLRGIRSRRLANAVGEGFLARPQAQLQLQLAEWVASMDLVTWRFRFDASAAELADLLEYAAGRGANLAAQVLNGGTAAIYLPNGQLATAHTPIRIRPLREPAPARLGVFQGSRRLGLIPAAQQADVSLLISVGLELQITDDYARYGSTVTIKLGSPA